MLVVNTEINLKFVKLPSHEAEEMCVSLIFSCTDSLKECGITQSHTLLRKEIKSGKLKVANFQHRVSGRHVYKNNNNPVYRVKNEGRQTQTSSMLYCEYYTNVMCNMFRIMNQAIIDKFIRVIV